MEDYFQAKAQLFTAGARRARRGQPRRRVRPAARRGRRGPGHHLLRGRATRPPTGGPRTSSSAPTAASFTRRRAPTASSADAPGRRCPGRSTSPTPLAAIVALVAAGIDRCRPPPTASPRRRACPAGWSGSTRASRTSRVVDYAHKTGRRRVGAARAAPGHRGQAASSCSAAAATATGPSARRWAPPRPGSPTSPC